MSTESTVQMFFTLIRNWLKKRDDLYFYMVIPEDSDDTDLQVSPKTHVIKLPDAVTYYDKHSTVPQGFYENFSMRVGKYPIDVVITPRTNAVTQLQRQLWDYRLKDVLPVIIDEDMAVNPGAMPAPMSTSEIDMMNRSLAYVSGWPIFDTTKEMENAIITARKYLSGTMIRKLIDRCRVLPVGVDVDWIDQHIPYGIPKNNKFTLFFGGRLNQAKRAKDLVEVYDRMYAAGRDIRIILCTPKEDGAFYEQHIRSKGRSEIEVYNYLPPHEFYGKAASAHVYLASSKMEGFSIGFLEQIYMAKYGLVPILPDLPWCRTLLPIDKYKLVYKNFTEAHGMIAWVYDNYEQAVAEAQWLSQYVEENYNTQTTAWKYFEYVEQRVNEFNAYRSLFTSGAIELIKECVDRLREPFSLDDLYKMIGKYAIVSKYEPIRGKASKYAIYKWLIEEGGYRDLHDGPVPMLVKA